MHVKMLEHTIILLRNKASSGQCDYIRLITLHCVDTFSPYLGCIKIGPTVYIAVDTIPTEPVCQHKYINCAKWLGSAAVNWLIAGQIHLS